MDLFRANNHSKWKIEYRLSNQEIQRELAKLVTENYKLASVEESSIAQVCELEKASNNYRIKVRETNENDACILLRKNIRVGDVASIELLEKTALYLEKEEIFIPKLLKTKDNRYHFLHGGFVWQVYEYVEGNHYRGTYQELSSMARGTALLHRAFQKYPYGEEVSQRVHFLPPWEIKDFLAMLQEACKRNKTDIDKIFLEYKDFLETTSEETYKSFKKVHGVSRQIIHGDLHPHNTLFDKGNLKAILDFEMIQFSELLREIAFVAHRFARQYAIYNGGGAKEAQIGFAYFLKEYGAINHLSFDEIQMLPMFIQDELFRRIIKDFSLYYFKNESRYASAEELKKKIMLLQEAKLLLRG